MNKKIFIALGSFAKYGDRPLRLLEENGFTYLINPLGRRLVQEEVVEMGKGCKGIIAGLEPYNDYVLDNLIHLRCISRCGAGVDNISLRKAREKGIVVCNTAEVVIRPVAELAVAMIFDLLKRLSLHTSLMKSGRWERKIGNLLTGKVIGILGLGRIGRAVAEIIGRIGAEVYGTDIVPDGQWAGRTGVKIVSLKELLRVSDVLSIHLSFSEDNPFRLGEKEINMMKKGAMIINVSRGNFIDEDALYKALKTGYLAGAALDVFSEEPYTGKLCGLENIILTPHIATFTEESRLQMEVEATKNLIDFLDGVKNK